MEIRPSPCDILTEAAVISALIIAPEKRREAKSLLSSADFYDSKNRTLFEIAGSCDGDLIALLSECDKHPDTEKLRDHLLKVSETTSTSAGLRYHIDILRDLGRRRTLIALAQQIDAQARESDPLEVVSYAHTKLTALEMQDTSRAIKGVHLGNVYTPERAIKAYSEYVDSLRQSRFITGIRPVDHCIRGVGPGEVLTIIARAGTFKTALLQNLLLNYTQHSAWGALFFSLEMPVASVAERYGQMIEGCSGRSVENYYTQDGSEIWRPDFEKRYCEALKNLFVVPSKCSLQDIIRYVDLVQKEYKIKIGVIGIDYLGLIDAISEKEYEQVSKLARGVKDLAKFLKIPLITLVQTSRKAGTGETEIEGDMARGSGAIEEAADFLLGLFRPEEKKVVCKILKNRKGPKGPAWVLELNFETFKIGQDAEEWTSDRKSKAQP